MYAFSATSVSISWKINPLSVLLTFHLLNNHNDICSHLASLSPLTFSIIFKISVSTLPVINLDKMNYSISPSIAGTVICIPPLLV